MKKRVEKWLVGVEEWGTQGEVIKGYKLWAIRWIRSEDLMCNMVTVIDNIIVYLKLAKRVEFKCSHQKQNKKQKTPQKPPMINMWGDRYDN